jgi:hypothetical protein
MGAQIVRQALTRTLIVFAVVAVVAGYYFGQVDVAGFHIGLGRSTLQTERGVDPDASKKSEPNVLMVEGMLMTHGCWQGAAPEGAIPGHVVVTLEGDDHPTYGGKRHTTAALNQVLFGEGHIGQVHGFCR